MAEDRSDSDQTRQWFGVNLRTQREARGMSQDDVARGMVERGFRWHQSTTAKVERGARAVEVTEAVAVAGLLQSTVDALLAEPSEVATEADLRRATRDAAIRRGAVAASARRMLDGLDALSAKLDALGMAGDVEADAATAGSPVAMAAFVARGEAAWTPEVVVEWVRGNRAGESVQQPAAQDNGQGGPAARELAALPTMLELEQVHRGADGS